MLLRKYRWAAMFLVLLITLYPTLADRSEVCGTLVERLDFCPPRIQQYCDRASTAFDGVVCDDVIFCCYTHYGYTTTKEPTNYPSTPPTRSPSSRPSRSPTAKPTKVTSVPSVSPTSNPTTHSPTRQTRSPTPAPSDAPSRPSTHPTADPTPQPTPNPTPMNGHTRSPTRITAAPSEHPTPQPTPNPTNQPVIIPSTPPTELPTPEPSPRPTAFPTRPTLSPTPEPTPRPTPNPIVVIAPIGKGTGFAGRNAVVAAAAVNSKANEESTQREESAPLIHKHDRQHRHVQQGWIMLTESGQQWWLSPSPILVMVPLVVFAVCAFGIAMCLLWREVMQQRTLCGLGERTQKRYRVESDDEELPNRGKQRAEC
eukprot:CAMPEP_0197044254 /NCGR_PEP_ID=MMETSP1384-20130603/20355_1 /TAXON_ID=29189 /ORGANISM="Ammonia sp." /LENGTH=368 /DNA_ID=CAMNT_0042475683 /DNA_START=43 /DNA_END=1149 /DNA_ORIENTATION=-